VTTVAHDRSKISRRADIGAREKPCRKNDLICSSVLFSAARHVHPACAERGASKSPVAATANRGDQSDDSVLATFASTRAIPQSAGRVLWPVRASGAC
jgi:hypothetical protein